MKFTFKKLGYIDQGSLELGNLTVICGSNNFGKSYTSHAIHGILSEARKFKDFIIPDDTAHKLIEDSTVVFDLNEQTKYLPDYLKAISANFKSNIGHFFNVYPDFFHDTGVAIESDGLSFDFSCELNEH